MKFSQITLRAPSPHTRDPRFTSDKYDIEASEGLITARPLSGSGPTLVWAYSNFSEAFLLDSSQMTESEKELLRTIEARRAEPNLDGPPHETLEIKPSVVVPSPELTTSLVLDAPPIATTAQQPRPKQGKYRR